MNFKRPSMFTFFIVCGCILIIFAIVMILIGVKSTDATISASDIDNIDSISGDENIMIDEEGNKENLSNNILSQKNVDVFEFDSFVITSNDGVSTISFEIYNSSEEDKELGEYELRILDQYSNIIGRIIDDAGIVEGLSRKEVSLSLKGDIANLSDIQISKIIYKEI